MAARLKRQKDDWFLTLEELAEYERLHGQAAAASLLLLTPPDRFAGDYEETFAGLTTELTTKQRAKCAKMTLFDINPKA